MSLSYRNETIFLHADQQIKSKEYKKALLICDEWEKKGGADYKIHLIRAVAFFKLNNLTSAFSNLKQALDESYNINQKAFKFAQKYTKKLLLKYAELHPEEEIDDTNEDQLADVKNVPVTLSPQVDKVNAFLTKGLEFLQTRQIEYALQNLEQAAQLNKALKDYERKEVNSETTCELLMRSFCAGLIAKTEAHDLKELSYLKRASEIIKNLNNHQDKRYLAFYYSVQGVIARANLNPSNTINYFDQAVALDPDMNAYRYSRALAYIWMGKYTKAKEDLDILLKKDKTNRSYNLLHLQVMMKLNPIIIQTPAVKTTEIKAKEEKVKEKEKKSEKEPEIKAETLVKTKLKKKKKNKKDKESQAKIMAVKDLCESIAKRLTTVTQLNEEIITETKFLNPDSVESLQKKLAEIQSLEKQSQMDLQKIQEDIKKIQKPEAVSLDVSVSEVKKIIAMSAQSKKDIQSFVAKTILVNEAKEKLNVALNEFEKYTEKRKALDILFGQVLENKDNSLNDSLQEATKLQKEMETMANVMNSHIDQANAKLDEVSKNSNALKPYRERLKIIKDKIKPKNMDKSQKKVTEIEAHLVLRKKLQLLQDRYKWKLEEIQHSIEEVKKTSEQLSNINKEFKLFDQGSLRKLDLILADALSKKIEEQVSVSEANIKEIEKVAQELNSLSETQVSSDFSEKQAFLKQSEQTTQDEINKLKTKQDSINKFEDTWNRLQLDCETFERLQLELTVLTANVLEDKDNPSEDSLAKADELTNTGKTLGSLIQKNISEIEDFKLAGAEEEIAKTKEKIAPKNIDNLQEKVVFIEEHLKERAIGKANLENYRKGTPLTEEDINFLFNLADEFPQFRLYGSAASKTQRELKISDIDARILVEEKALQATMEKLIKRGFIFDPSVNVTFSGTNINKFYKYTFTLPGSKLKVDLTLGRSEGPYKYVGDELILPDITGQLLLSRKPINDENHVSHFMGSNRHFVLIKSEFFLDFQYTHKHPDELWAFGYEDPDVQKQKPKGYLNILVKHIEKKRENKSLNEEKLKKIDFRISLSDQKTPIYSWGAIKNQWIKSDGILARKMASSESDRRDCYLEIHTLIKERKDGIKNNDAKPFIEAFFDALIENHTDRKNVILESDQLRNEVISILTKLYSNIPYPNQNSTLAILQYDLITNAVMEYRKQYPKGNLDRRFVQSCISAIKNQSYTISIPSQSNQIKREQQVIGKTVEQQWVTVATAFAQSGLTFSGRPHELIGINVFDVVIHPETKQAMQRLLTMEEIFLLNPAQLASKYICVNVEKPVYGYFTQDSQMTTLCSPGTPRTPQSPVTSLPPPGSNYHRARSMYRKESRMGGSEIIRHRSFKNNNSET